MRDEILQIASGALAGAVGTLVIGKELALGKKLPEKLQPAGPNQDPGKFLVDKLAERAPGMSEKTQQKLAKGSHLAYGMGFGALFGLLRATTSRRLGVGGALVAGAALGAMVWAAGYLGWLPVVGLADPVHKQGAGALTSLAAHVGYGVTTALPFAAAEHLLKA